MQKRSVKIHDQLLATAKNKEFSKEMVLYIKEAVRLIDEGFVVDRVFSKEFNHSNRESYLYRISWKEPISLGGFAEELYQQTLLAL